MSEMTPETLKKLGDFAEHNWGDGGEMRDELYAAASAWEADRKARIEIEQAYSDLQDEHMVLHQELGAAQTRIGALERIAAGYRDHIDDDCDRSGCFCDLREHRCSGWIDAALAKPPK